MATKEDFEGIERAISALTEQAFISPNVPDGNGEPANVVDTLDALAHAIHLLGNADASSPMGALEAHGKAVLDSAEMVSSGLHDIADAIRESSETAKK